MSSHHLEPATMSDDELMAELSAYRRAGSPLPPDFRNIPHSPQTKLPAGLAVMGAALFGLMTMAAPVGAQDYQPRGRQESSNEYLAAHVRVNGNSGTMYEQRNYYVTLTMGPVGVEGIPTEIRLGDVIEVDGREMHVGLIVATEFFEDMEWNGEILGRKGQVDCVAAENAENLPWVDENTWRNRLWIEIKDCTVLNGKP